MPDPKPLPAPADAPALYLDLLKRCLLGSPYAASEGMPWPASFPLRRLWSMLLPADVRLLRRVTAEQRATGNFWPTLAHTMIGQQRLDNLQFCCEDVLRNNIPGDFIETGVWRGGACILMRAILRAHGVSDRQVWVADSFEGLPRPDEKKYAADAGDRHYLIPELAVSLEQVRANFEKYGLLDEQVKFLQGWFKDTLPTAPIKQLAVARLDGDLYESTMDALVSLYPKLSRGGYLIVDDYHAVPACKKAVHDFREKHGIGEAIQEIDGVGAFWKREGM